MMYWLAIVGIAGSLGMAFNTLSILWLAYLCGGRLTLEFKRYHELMIELGAGSIFFILGLVGAIWLAIAWWWK